MLNWILLEMAVINLQTSISPCPVVGTEAWRGSQHCNLVFMFEPNSWESMLVMGRRDWVASLLAHPWISQVRDIKVAQRKAGGVRRRNP